VSNDPPELAAGELLGRGFLPATAVRSPASRLAASRRR